MSAGQTLKLGTGAGAAIAALSGGLCFGHEAAPRPEEPQVLALRASVAASAIEGVTVEARNVPTLIERPLVRAVVRDACIALRARLGQGYPLVLEETTDPDEGPAAEPRLHVLVRVAVGDDAALQQIDKFVSERWVREPVEARRVVRIGSEFI